MAPRLALIFPPAMHPTSPPLGLACLRAYLQARSPSGPVKSFDLNLAHYDQALRWMEDGRLKMSLQKQDHASTARHVAEVVSLFRGERGLDDFLDMSCYDRSASIYQSFETVLNGLFESFARKILLGRTVPPLVDAYFKELIEPVRRFEPDLIGLSILFSQQLYFALAIAKYLKQNGTKVALGGATLSVMPRPERLLAEDVTIKTGEERHELNIGKFVDYLVVGEGEAGILGLMDRFGADISEVPGLAYIENGCLKFNPPAMVEDPNELPVPDFSDFAIGSYHSPLPILPYLSSRGCFWGRCAFCTHQKTYLAYREEAAERTASRLAELSSRYGAHHFNLVDEMIHPLRFKRLGRAIVDNDLDIRYSAYAKPTKSFGEGLARILYQSGARVLMWGVESGSQRVLDAMKKGTHVEEMENVLDQAHREGIWNLVFVMFGFPSETMQEWKDTLDLLERHAGNIDALSKSLFILLAGSDIFQQHERFAISRIMDRPDRDPISVAYDYEVDRGLRQDEARNLYNEQAAKLKGYGRSPHFGMYRDHMLIHASGR